MFDFVSLGNDYNELVTPENKEPVKLLDEDHVVKTKAAIMRHRIAQYEAKEGKFGPEAEATLGEEDVEMELKTDQDKMERKIEVAQTRVEEAKAALAAAKKAHAEAEVRGASEAELG